MSVNVRSVSRSDADTATALAEIDAAIGDARPDFVFAFYGQGHDDAALNDYLRGRFADTAIVGGTSCAGVMSNDGIGGPESIGFLLVEDAEGDYGAAAMPLGEDPAAAAQSALESALVHAGCAGELPELVWVFQTPGSEEAVVEGLRRVVGDRCPILGGSAADDDVSGRWRQIGPDGVVHDSVAVAVLFSSGGIGISFQGGYAPTGVTGVVTAMANGNGNGNGNGHASDRTIARIDGLPAAVAYDGWIGHILPPETLTEGGNILADTTMCPLGVGVGAIEDVTQFRLIHPEAVAEGGALRTFAAVEEGTRLYAMTGDRERLIRRVGGVAEEAASAVGGEIAGGMIVYCGGCLLAVGEESERVAATAADALDDAPFLGCFTFGEQGTILGRNVHANLMISAVVFGR